MLPRSFASSIIDAAEGGNDDLLRLRCEKDAASGNEKFWTREEQLPSLFGSRFHFAVGVVGRRIEIFWRELFWL
jgi:hypothetical protein